MNTSSMYTCMCMYVCLSSVIFLPKNAKPESNHKEWKANPKWVTFYKKNTGLWSSKCQVNQKAYEVRGTVQN